MSICEPFIRRPVATTLLTIAIALAGGVAFRVLPVSPLPQVDFPTISVSATLPGASAETMASSVATPLERQLGHIAAVSEMTSISTLGSTSITLQFNLNRNIDAAARDVQAGIAAARSYLPTNLTSNPTYKKVNPADSPIMIVTLTSKVLDKTQMYDSASTIMAQKLSQIQGVGQVTVGGSALPSVRVELNPDAVNKYGIGFEQVRTALASANANKPKGHFSSNGQMWEVGANDQIFKAADYAPLIVGYSNGAPVRISDIGEAIDSVQDVRNAGYANVEPSVLVIIYRQPGANIIDTVDRVKEALPQLHAAIPAAIDMRVALDQTVTIRASVHDVERSLGLSVFLVVLVVFFFLRNARTTFIPSVAVPVSLIGTFGVMYLVGFSVDNLSMMALTISTGFVVDDAIVVIENITRYIEQGMQPIPAALKGAEEIGSTVLTISISLVAVFIPLLLMGGIVGRLLREFAVTLSVAIGISMVISLTATPMMCAHLLKHRPAEGHGWFYRASEAALDWAVRVYARALRVVLRHSFITLLILLGTVGLSGYLFFRVPKGFFPAQDTGRLNGNIQADQATSFQQLDKLLREYESILHADPTMDTVMGFAGGGTGRATDTARVFMSLKPLGQRTETAQQIIDRLRPKLAKVPGATLYLTAAQDVRVGGRQANADYQYTMTSDNVQDLVTWAPKMLDALKTIKIIADVNTDQQNRGLETYVDYDRATAARLGISSQLIDATLYDAFGQAPVSTMYTSLNQYFVVMEAAPKYWQSPDILKRIFVTSTNGQHVPLAAFAHFNNDLTALAVSHQGLFPAATISFNLLNGVALGDAENAISAKAREVGLPSNIQTGYVGTAEAYQDSLSSEPLLVAAALITVYLVLGILYESYIHPITILSTLPSAGVGAVLALILTHNDLDVIGIIGIILLIGLVKKNAILMIDFAIATERQDGKSSREAIFEACQLRFRPIMMTTMAALLGALPLALGHGTGSELRRPLGITIIGGLIVSQSQTLFTTPVVYLYFDRLQHFLSRLRKRKLAGREPVGSEA